MNEVKRALSLLLNNKSEDPHTIKNEFVKYGGEAIAILLKDEFQQILQSEDNSSIITNIDKSRQDKEKLDNKRGISLASINYIINRLNNYLQFTEAQVGAQPGKTTNQLVSIEICNTTEDDPK